MKIMLAGGPTTDQLEYLRKLQTSNAAPEAAPMTMPHVGFRVLDEALMPTVGFGGKLRKPPRLEVQFTDIPTNLQLTQHHLRLKAVVVTDFADGPLMMDDVDAGKAGTELELSYDRVSHTASVERATPPKES